MVKAIDVSSYQKIIDWSKVKASGIEYSILKIIRKDLMLDTQFIRNYKECLSNGVKVIGVYNYSYATTTEKARTDALAVVDIMLKNNLPKDIIVWLDIEDNCQKGLNNLLVDIINSYYNVILGVGYKFGIYTGQNFYDTYLKAYSSIFTIPFWIAKYSTISPSINNKLYGWQYSSKGIVNGISGNVDMNYVYHLEKEELQMAQNYASKIVNWMLAQEGYLEKKSNSQLESKTANAGSANYTKFGEEMHRLFPSVMDFPAPWCDMIVDDGFYQCYGITNAQGLLGGGFNDYTVASAQLYKNKGAYYKSNPKYGDQIFFKNSKGKICHTGIVTGVDSKKVYTSEGNTSSKAGVVANGGCVRNKEYLLTYKYIDGYGRPKYDPEPIGFIDNGLDYSLVFNPDYYVSCYVDLKIAFGSDSAKLFSHFVSDGMREGRVAISTFNVHLYRARYADLQIAFGADLKKYYQHYITDGKREGRIGN